MYLISDCTYEFNLELIETILLINLLYLEEYDINSINKYRQVVA